MSCYRRLDKFNHRRQTCLCAPSAPQPETRIFFVKSTVCHGSLSAVEMYEFLRDTVNALRDQNFTVIAITGDNARAQQSAIEKMSVDYPWGQKYTSLKNGVTTPGIVTNALAFYEKYTVNFVTKILHCINGNCSDISPKARNWLELLSNDRLQDLDELVMQRMISSTPADETVSRLKRFADLVLSKIILSEAEVERVFSRHKSIHTKMRSKLDPTKYC